MLERLQTLPAGRRAKWAIVAVWLAAALALGWMQPRLQAATENDPASFLPEAAEATEVRTLLAERLPGGDEVPALVVYRRAGGLAPPDREAIARHARELGAEPGPQAEAVAALSVPLAGTTIEDLEPAVADVRTTIAERPAGLEAFVTGPAGILVDVGEVFGAIDVTLLLATTALILVLLVSIYRSPFVALVPLFVVACAYAVTAGIVYLLVASLGLELNGQTTGLLIVLMFGAGTDYCLLIVARFREELTRHADAGDAMAATVRSTSPAILSSGSTVAAAMLVLLVAQLSSTRNAGPVLALGIGFIMLAGLTLLPAVLLVLGRGAFWPRTPRAGDAEGGRRRVWERVAALVRRRPVAVLAVTVPLLVAGTAGNAVSLPGLGIAAGFRNDPESVRGLEALAEALPAGAVSPTDVVVRAAPEQLETATGRVAAALGALPGVADVRAGGGSEDGTLAHLEVALAGSPYEDAAVDLVPVLRERASAAAATVAGDALVGGPTAEEADSRTTVRRDLLLIAPLALALIFLILVALLRSAAAPAFLVASQVLTFFTALGVSYAAFAWVFDAPGSSAGLPTFVFIFTVALGIDYTIFLMARVREEAIDRGHEEGVVTGLVHTGGVISSAGVILAGTFLVLMVLPLEQLFQLGFAIAFGVALDAFVVRTLVVPAVALLLGRATWWPGGPARFGLSRRKRV
jgi:putative drug exporter of the RND superfamily